MKYWSRRFSFLVVVIVLIAMVHLSRGRRVRIAEKSASIALHEEEEVEETTTKPKYATAEFYRQFRQRFSGAAEKSSERLLLLYDEKHDPVYGVSGREVPGGPNPLHN